MRLSLEYRTPVPAASTRAAADPAAPDLSILSGILSGTVTSFFDAIERATAANPVPTARLLELAAKARGGALPAPEAEELDALTRQARRQGLAIGAVIGAFLKLTPYRTLEEIRRTAKLFQPAFGPVLVVDGAAVRDMLERHHDFTVEPYGAEMRKVMSPAHNGGFETFILSTDDDAVYLPDKQLLSAVCNSRDAELITETVHEECVRRVTGAVADARSARSDTIDIVPALARYVPVAVGHRYLGVPVTARPGTFDLTPEMITCYGTPIDGLPETALSRADGVIPDEHTMYLWIKAAFQHFFNNVQKDRQVGVQGFRACRQLLACILREVAIQRERLLRGEPVGDTMLARLVQFQLGRSAPGVPRPPGLDPRLVSDLRIAENVMGTIVGAVAGQEEATCRAIDALIRLQEGEFRTSGPGSHRYGRFEEVTALARSVLNGVNAQESRARLKQYVLEGLRLQPQGEVLLRRCARDGARVADSRPMPAGTPVFAAHGSAMKDVPEPDAFVLDRPARHNLLYGWNRHACLGRFVSPVIIVESVVALFGLLDLRRPAPRPGEPSFPLERRFGRLQLDDRNLYATTFSLQFDEAR